MMHISFNTTYEYVFKIITMEKPMLHTDKYFSYNVPFLINIFNNIRDILEGALKVSIKAFKVPVLLIVLSLKGWSQ